MSDLARRDDAGLVPVKPEVAIQAYESLLHLTERVLSDDDDFLIRLTRRRSASEEWEAEFFVSMDEAMKRKAFWEERGFEVRMAFDPVKKACNKLRMVYGISIESVSREDNFQEALRLLSEGKTAYAYAKCVVWVRDRFGRMGIGEGFEATVLSPEMEFYSKRQRRTVRRPITPKEISDALHKVYAMASTSAQKRAINSLAVYRHSLTDKISISEDDEILSAVVTVKPLPEEDVGEEQKEKTEEQQDEIPNEGQSKVEVEEGTAETKPLFYEKDVDKKTMEHRRKEAAQLGSSSDLKIKRDEFVKKFNLPPNLSLIRRLTDEGWEKFVAFVKGEDDE